MDAGSKLIRQISFTPASTHDSQLLADLVSEDERSLFGDKAYSNDSVKHQARQSGWQVGILDNPKKSHSLSVSQKKRNKRHRRMHRQVRARLLFDQGSLWHAPGSIQDRTTQPGQFMMKSICWNIERRDRKSTRLNSSHVSISYAVFCLNKKIKIIVIIF